MPKQRKYHYTVMMASWAYSLEKFNQLKHWAQETQSSFWWNHMSGPLEIFSFWAYPEDVLDIFAEMDMTPTMNLKIYTDPDALPQYEGEDLL